MALSFDQVKAIIAPDEPRETEMATLDEEALPHLERLIRGPDRSLAVKAGFALSRLGGSVKTLPIIERLLAETDSPMRVAASRAIHALPELQARPLLGRLLTDRDAGVRKNVLLTMNPNTVQALRPELERVASSDEHSELR